MRGLAAVLVLMLVTGLGGLTWWRCEGGEPRVSAPEKLALGRAGTELELGVADPESGLRRLRVTLRHAGGEQMLFEKLDYPGSLAVGGQRGAAEQRVKLRIDPRELGLAKGDASLEVEASDWSWASLFSGNTTHLSIPVRVDLQPPVVSVESGLTYVRRGGAGAVVYTLDEAVERDGVEVGDAFYRGYPFPAPGAAPGRRFALFAVPRDAPEPVSILVVATDAAGNRGEAGWATQLQPQVFEDVQIELTEGFLQGKVRTLARLFDMDAEDPLGTFQKINTEMRAANEAKIREIVAGSGSERRGQGGFDQLANSAVTSRFAEHRTYVYQGRPVSQAIHYGYDLASTAHAEIDAANAGSVLFADDLGIYGKCVVLDHGLGLTSLYAHLSRIDVKVGDGVGKGQPLGVSGSTGLAGGDHLHFAILVGATYVDPKEWWDARWVAEHVEAQLAPPVPAP